MNAAGSLQLVNHCGQKIKPSEVWFLSDTKDCSNRILHIGVCPRCLKELTCLIETSKTENKTYNNTKSGKKALKEIELCRLDKLYTSNDLRIKKGKPCGWTYGENIEIHNNKGEVIAIKQKRCDYFGQKEVIKKICLQHTDV